LRQVWTYHEKIVIALEAQDYDDGYRLLIQHTSLLRNREALHPHDAGEQPPHEQPVFADIS
jgi:hypothetical protein